MATKKTKPREASNLETVTTPTLDDVLRPLKGNSTDNPKASSVKRKKAAPVAATPQDGAGPDDTQSTDDGNPQDWDDATPTKRSMDQISDDIYRRAAQRVVDAISAGTSIWQKSWTAPTGRSRPVNAFSNLPYQGVNRVILLCEMLGRNLGHDTRFMTYKQVALMAKGMANDGVATDKLPHVKKGAEGIPIYKLGFVEKKHPVVDAAGKPVLDEDGKPKVRIVRGKSYMKSYVVFHASSVENMDPFPATETEAKPQWEVRAELEDLVQKLGVNVVYEPTDRPCYRPSTDTVFMPERSQWKTPDDHYAVLAHECAHATGAAHRLARPGITELTSVSGGRGFGSESYAFEELISETASLFINQSYGLNSQVVLDQHASYLAGWQAKILSDPAAMFKAFAEAEKAAEFFMQRLPSQVEAAAKAAEQNMAHQIKLGHAGAVINGAQIPTIKTVDMAGDAMALASSSQWQGGMSQSGLTATPGGM
jgi:antirestriction protein ArdC